MPHQSEVLLTMKRLILETLTPNSPKEIKDLLLQYLHIMKILLINDFNKNQSVQLEFHDIFINVILGDVEKGIKEKAVDCLSMILDFGNLVNKAVKNEDFCIWLSQSFTEFPQDVVTQGSMLDIFIVCFKSGIVTKKLLEKNNNLVNQMIKILPNIRSEHSVLRKHLEVYNFYF